jgi:hypothetical protein
VFLETDVADPDLHGSALSLLSWILIHIPNKDQETDQKLTNKPDLQPSTETFYLRRYV